MGKGDIDAPPRPPAKRRQLEVALPQWLAVWANDPDLTPSDRRRAQQERDRRKRLDPDPVTLGVVMADEGCTPPQLDAVMDAIVGLKPTAVLHTRLPRRVHGVLMAACRNVGAEARLCDDKEGDRTVIRESSHVVAAPREPVVRPYATPGVWAMVGLARHRSLPVWVVLPDGTSLQGDELRA